MLARVANRNSTDDDSKDDYETNDEREDGYWTDNEEEDIVSMRYDSDWLMMLFVAKDEHCNPCYLHFLLPTSPNC